MGSRAEEIFKERAEEVLKIVEKTGVDCKTRDFFLTDAYHTAQNLAKFEARVGVPQVSDSVGVFDLDYCANAGG